VTNAHATMKLLTMRTKVEKKNIIIHEQNTNSHCVDCGKAVSAAVPGWQA